MPNYRVLIIHPRDKTGFIYGLEKRRKDSVRRLVKIALDIPSLTLGDEIWIVDVKEIIPVEKLDEYLEMIRVFPEKFIGSELLGEEVRKSE